MKRMVLVAAALIAPVVAAEEPARAPDAVRRLEGCWQGVGEVIGKPVTIAVRARPVALGAMMALDADSVAIANPSDRYAAHLVLGGGKETRAVTGFWSDSFGGTMTATGNGTAQADGFDISYLYSDAEFVNRWRISGEQLAWTIFARDKAGRDALFARYRLKRENCVHPVLD
jgi:hypothetical protein